MAKSKKAMKIPVKNIYAMLAYAYPDLVNDQLEGESSMFDSLDELLSEILLYGINRQLKRGLYKTYVGHEENLTMIRGKIDMHESIRLKTQLSRQLHCTFDEFDKNNFYNQVLKSTALLIIRQGRVCQRKRKRLRDMLFFFHEIDEIQLRAIVWEDIRFHKDKIAYRSLISLCYLIYNGVLEDEETNQPYITELAMSDLYGRFLQHFYLKECPHLHLSYQGKSLASMQETATGMKSALTVDMILSDQKIACLYDYHYYDELLEISNEQDNKKTIMEHMTRLIRGLKKLPRESSATGKKQYGVLLYPSLDENYLEAYPLAGGSLYLGAINLRIPFDKIREELIQVANLERA